MVSLESKFVQYASECKKVLFRGTTAMGVVINMADFISDGPFYTELHTALKWQTVDAEMKDKVSVHIIAGDGTAIDKLLQDGERVWYVVTAGCGKRTIDYMGKFDMVVDFKGDKISGILRYIKEAA